MLMPRRGKGGHVHDVGLLSCHEAASLLPILAKSLWSKPVIVEERQMWIRFPGWNHAHSCRRQKSFGIPTPARQPWKWSEISKISLTRMLANHRHTLSDSAMNSVVPRRMAHELSPEMS